MSPFDPERTLHIHFRSVAAFASRIGNYSCKNKLYVQKKETDANDKTKTAAIPRAPGPDCIGQPIALEQRARLVSAPRVFMMYPLSGNF